jgi:hypothetical protein
MENRVLMRGEKLEVLDRVVRGIVVDVMNVMIRRNGAVMMRPHNPVKVRAAELVVGLVVP